MSPKHEVDTPIIIYRSHNLENIERFLKSTVVCTEEVTMEEVFLGGGFEKQNESHCVK